MKYDIIIIGGGESGLHKGIELAKKGKDVAIFSFGKSTIAIRHAAKDILNYGERLKEGVKIEDGLKKEFRMAGGMIFEGDMINGGKLVNDGNGLKVASLASEKLQDEILTANEYYLASGTFVSRGLRSNYQRIYEPVFNLDVDAPATHAEWINDDFYAEQPFMKAHVLTDNAGHAIKDGKTINNLFCIGSISGK